MNQTKYKVGDKFTHLHFGIPQNVTITEIKDNEYFCSNDGYNGGAWLYDEQITELNKRYLNPLNWSK